MTMKIRGIAMIFLSVVVGGCASSPPPAKSASTQGTVEFVNADGYPSFPSTSPGYDCNKKKNPGVEVIYTSEKDFVGTDRFTVQGIGPKGKYMETDYTVRVLAPK